MLLTLLLVAEAEVEGSSFKLKYWVELSSVFEVVVQVVSLRMVSVLRLGFVPVGAAGPVVRVVVVMGGVEVCCWLITCCCCVAAMDFRVAFVIIRVPGFVGVPEQVVGEEFWATRLVTRGLAATTCTSGGF